MCDPADRDELNWLCKFGIAIYIFGKIVWDGVVIDRTIRNL